MTKWRGRGFPLLWVLYMLCLVFSFPGQSWAQTEEVSSDDISPYVTGESSDEVILPEVEEQLGALDTESIDQFIAGMDQELQAAIPGSLKEVIQSMVSGEMEWNPKDILSHILKAFFREVVANASLLGKLVILAIICVVLQNLSTAFDKGSTGQLTYVITYLVLVSLAVASFAVAVDAGREVVDKMVSFMQILMPLLLTLLVTVGGITSAAIFQPILFASFTIMGTIIRNVVLPLLFFSAVLSIASNLSPRLKLSNMAGLFKTVAMTMLGCFITIFLGLLSIQGVAGAVGDGVALRVVKYTTDAFVPVVGGMFSSALEAIVSSSLLIKNAVGIVGVIIALLIMIMPLLKILCLAFIYKLASALIQPVGDGQVTDCLQSLGNNLIAVFAAVAVVGLMFFFAIVVVVAVGNMTVMLR